MEKLCEIKEKAIDLLEMGISQDVKDICSKELYELMDIIKDIEETMYYHKVIESMEEHQDDYSKHFDPNYRDRMYYSSMHEEEKTLEDHISEIYEMINGLDASERAQAKQKLIQFVNKI